MNQKGISLVEVVLAAAVVIFLALLINSLPSSISSINKSKHSSIARDIASKEIEFLRKQDYDNLVIGSNTFTDSKLLSLPSSNASYNIEDCPPQICTQSEKIKKATVAVYWLESGENKKVELTTLISDGGLGQ